MLNDWLEAHGHQPALESEIPNTGFIVVDSNIQPLAIAFLRMVEGSIALAEGLVTNPTLPPIPRARAAHKAVQALIDETAALGIKYLLATTASPGVARMIQRRFKFESSPQKLFVKII